MNSNLLELFTFPTQDDNVDWAEVIRQQYCPLIGRTCIKVRKSQPEISIGTCSVKHGVKNSRGVIICPFRFLERKQVFMDCLHLLTLHEPGNELHRVAEMSLPGGNVDYFLVSVRGGKVVDFAGIELQAVDTTGTLWPERQRFLRSVGLDIGEGADISKPYGINWKMTAKTILVQLHHKVETFERLGKHFVIVLQDNLLEYMRREFNFQHIQDARLGDSMHFHAYSLQARENQLRLELASRASTDAAGIASSLGLQVSPRVELEVIIAAIESRLSAKTLLTV